MDSTRFNIVESGWETVSTLLFNKIERLLNAMFESVCQGLYLCMGEALLDLSGEASTLALQNKGQN